MHQLHKATNSFNQFLFTLLCIYLTALLLCYPAIALDYASTGLNLWFQKMIPTLLPFMILSGVMIRMNLTEHFARLLHPLLHRLFGTTLNGSYTVVMGFLCGFPMGARVIGELRQNNKISIAEAEYLLAFCNNIGPIFFLSFVIPVLRLGRIALPLGIMYGVPLLYGVLLYRLHYRKKASFTPLCQKNDIPSASYRSGTSKASFLSAIDSSVVSGLIGIAKLGGYMVFFNLLNIITVPMKNLPDNLLYFYNCILEITSGINRSGQSFTLPILILLPFGGFSCIAQTYSMIQGCGLSMGKYVFHKTVQTVITCLFYFFCAFFFSCRSIS